MYKCNNCGYVAKSYPAAVRHSKGLESVRADSTPDRPAHTDGWGVDGLTGRPIKHVLELVREQSA